MNVEVYDEDPGSDDIIGVAVIKLSALCVAGGIDEWFGIAYRGKSSGQVHLKGMFKPAAQGQAQPQMAAQQ